LDREAWPSPVSALFIVPLAAAQLPLDIPSLAAHFPLIASCQLPAVTGNDFVSAVTGTSPQTINCKPWSLALVSFFFFLRFFFFSLLPFLPVTTGALDLDIATPLQEDHIPCSKSQQTSPGLPAEQLLSFSPRPPAIVLRLYELEPRASTQKPAVLDDFSRASCSPSSALDIFLFSLFFLQKGTQLC
jgi:hypothetical protein